MSDLRWERIQALFHEAAELPAEEQERLLAARYPDEPEIAAEVLALLAEDRRPGSPLERDLAGIADRILEEGIGGGAPRTIGPYRLIRVIGEGGMGVVYLAERTDLENRVAIKILRDAWLSPARRERFAAEQRTLAQLNHPSIARLYDADSLPDGTPWFAMEYVEGVPITEYCAAHACPIATRLELVRAVCEAVLHAHQLAVIHRDLKPSNILVTRDWRVKLLDFGIAKPVDALASGVDQTRTELRLMTPGYAAPEQLRGQGLGVHTDIYALGVILYELLTGRLPFPTSDRSPAELQRILTDRAPEPPSIAAREASERPGWVRALWSERGAAWADLDVLCLNAMQPDPERRYRTVDSLIRDLDHYLRGEPLEARPDTLGYRLGKYLRRHWRPVSAAAAVFLVVVGLVAFYTVRLTRARNAAVAEAERTRRIQEFVNGIFEGGDEEAGPAESLRVVTLLGRGVQEAQALTGEPAIQAELYQTLGGIYQKLGDLDRADSLFRAALTERRIHLGPDHPDVAKSLVALGLLRADQSDLDEAERLVREGLAMAQRRARSQPAEVARATTALGLVLENRGSYGPAIEVLTRAVQLDSIAGLPLKDRVASLTELANSHFYAGHYGVSDSLNRAILEMDRGLYGSRHPHVASDLINLGAIQFEWGHYPEAERRYRVALEIYRAWYGDNHYETAASLTMLGRALIPQGRLPEAGDLLRQALSIRQRIYGPLHTSVASTLNELGRIAQQEGRLDEAEADFRRVAAIYRRAYHEKHYLIGIALSNLGGVHLARSENREAERLFREALRRYAETLPADHLYVGIARIKLGRSLLRQRRYAEAERESAAGYEIVAKQAAPSVSWLQNARQDLIGAYEGLGQPGESARYRAELERADAGALR